MRKILNIIRPAAIAGFAEVERAERIFYLEYLRENMIVFDVGANAGELTLMFSRFAAEVHAFEASAETFQRLENICGVFERNNVRINHLALSDKKGVIKMNIYDNAFSEFNSQAARPLKDYGLDIAPVKIEETEAATVDDYCREHGIERIDLLKIDVEGAELQVIKGAREMLENRRIKCLTFEFGQTTFDMGNRPEEIEAFLSAMNYRIGNIVKNQKTFPGRESVETAKFAMHVAVPK